jgi:Domain of unknown function (DUF4333)
VPGAVLEQRIQQTLAQKGASGAVVNCPNNIVVKVGTYVTCDLKGETQTGTVTFTFSDASGTVDASSVKTA